MHIDGTLHSGVDFTRNHRTRRNALHIAHSIAYTKSIYKNTSVSAEYLNTTDNDNNDDDVVTFRLAYEF